MNNRLIGFSVALVLAFAPAFADTTSNSSMTVAPSNSQYVNPVSNANASTQNVSTQINNSNLGANSFGQGITCQSPQIALGGFGSRENTGIGPAASDTGFSVQYLTPVGTQSTRSCQALADEVLHQRSLDTQLTMIQKCADFSRAGILLDPRTYPELSRACAGIRTVVAPAGAAPVPAYPQPNAAVPAPVARQSAMLMTARKIHLSDFSPAHNSELQRIAMHRIRHIAALEGRKAVGLPRAERVAVAEGLRGETARLRAVIAEYSLENAFLRRISKDKSWRAAGDTASVRQRALSYNVTDQGS